MVKKKILVKILGVIITLAYGLLFSGTNNPALAVTPVEIYFSPDLAVIPPTTVFKLMIDPRSQPISFLQTTIFFDPTKLQLSAEVIPNNSFLITYLNPTAIAEANATGTMELILYQRPGTTAPNNTFEIASVPFTYTAGATPSVTDVTIVDEETQIVDSTAQELPFTTRYASVTVGSASGSSGMAAAFAAMFKGSCASSDFIDTAIGCIPVKDQNAMAIFFLSWGLGIAGGIAFILIVYSAYKIMTSAGDPHRLQAGKELLTAAISGLVLLVTSAFILRVIGINMLGISGF